jgi:purine-binding chemotaxis protein CheW
MVATTESDPQAPALIEERQIVAIHLADEVYGIDIAHIHTVITPQPITPVPKAMPWITGVINLRGRVVPTIDLRVRFGLSPLPSERSRSSRIVIVEVNDLLAGLVVDSVSEVMRFPASCVDPPSQIVASIETECVTGIARVPRSHTQREASTAQEASQDRLIILLDVYKALAPGSAGVEHLRETQIAA